MLWHTRLALTRKARHVQESSETNCRQGISALSEKNRISIYFARFTTRIRRAIAGSRWRWPVVDATSDEASQLVRRLPSLLEKGPRCWNRTRSRSLEKRAQIAVKAFRKKPRIAIDCDSFATRSDEDKYCTARSCGWSLTGWLTHWPTVCEVVVVERARERQSKCAELGPCASCHTTPMPPFCEAFSVFAFFFATFSLIGQALRLSHRSWLPPSSPCARLTAKNNVSQDGKVGRWW